MPKRIQSPSSINLYKQCPRKYFYQYILKLPTKPSIHLVRGVIVHEVLEHFFAIDLDSIDEKEFEFGFRNYMSGKLLQLWKKNSNKLQKLPLDPAQLEFYLIESQKMLNKFAEDFSKKLEKEMRTKPFKEAFKSLTPQVEQSLASKDLEVRGIIDAIHTDGENIVILDYKTSKKDVITPEYKLQLSIYALLYKLQYDKMPKEVGINFLKFGEKKIPVEEYMLKEAETEIKFVHEMTESDKIADYPKKTSPLCKWSSGQCDFYDECQRQP